MCDHVEVLDGGEYVCIKCGLVLGQEYICEEEVLGWAAEGRPNEPRARGVSRN